MDPSDQTPGRGDAASSRALDADLAVDDLLAVDLHGVDDSVRLLDLSLRLQGALRACADAEAQLQQLGRTLTHDLRAPVRQFASFVGLLEREKVDMSARAQNYLDHIATSTVSLTEKIDTLAQVLRDRRDSAAEHRAIAQQTCAEPSERLAVDGAA